VELWRRRAPWRGPGYDIGFAFRPGGHDAEVDGGAAEIGGVDIFDLARAFGRRVERRRVGRSEPCKHCKERTHLKSPHVIGCSNAGIFIRARMAIKASFGFTV